MIVRVNERAKEAQRTCGIAGRTDDALFRIGTGGKNGNPCRGWDGAPDFGP